MREGERERVKRERERKKERKKKKKQGKIIELDRKKYRDIRRAGGTEKDNYKINNGILAMNIVIERKGESKSDRTTYIYIYREREREKRKRKRRHMESQREK